MAANGSATAADSQRLTSLDALRGFDMFWILGADSFVYSLHAMSDNPVTRFLRRSSTMPNGRAFISMT